jgi:thymidylate kinase
MLLSMAVMERPRWTDERIDERFDRVDADICGLRTEMKEGFERIDKRFDQFEKRFDQIDKRFERVDARFESMQRNMTTWFIAAFSTFIAAFLSTSLG